MSDIGEQLATSLTRQLNRRAVLRRAASGMAAILLGLFGLAEPAAALVMFKCCALCNYPSGTCAANCTTNVWCWACYYALEDRDYLCCEHHSGSCGPSCPADYSCYRRLGTAPMATA